MRIGTLVFSLMFAFIQQSYAKSLDDNFLYSTVHITNNSTKSAGTGFIVSRKTSANKIVLFLISNKHVLLPRPIDPAQTDHLAESDISFNKSLNKSIRKVESRVVLRTTQGVLKVKGHANPTVDVAAIVISSSIEEAPGIAFAITEDRFATESFIKKNYVSAGDRVLVIGYPLNLVEQGHVIPVARNAVLATQPGESHMGLPAFLIDGTVLRGSSGSPVILPIQPYVWTGKHNVNIGKIQENHLIGVVKGHIKNWEMILRKTAGPNLMQEFTVTENAQLGLVFPADVILEVMDMFPYKRWIKVEDAQQPPARDN